VRLDASVEPAGATAVLGPFAARGVRRGVDANLAALKRTLEASRETLNPHPRDPSGGSCASSLVICAIL
jgi:hypothetical protein